MGKAAARAGGGVCAPLPVFNLTTTGVLDVEAFSSGRRTPAIRLLVCILCALFIFGLVAAPPAKAVAAEAVAVFGLAAVLSAATAALGYKLSDNAQGKATISQMCSALAADAVMGAKVIVGSKIWGLQQNMYYIKMQIKNGKTYLDSKVVAWCQQYLSQHGVYDEDSVTTPTGSAGLKVSFVGASYAQMRAAAVSAGCPDKWLTNIDNLIAHFNIPIDDSSRIWFIKGGVNSAMVGYATDNVLKPDVPATLLSSNWNGPTGLALKGQFGDVKVQCRRWYYQWSASGDYWAGGVSGSSDNQPFFYTFYKYSDGFIFSNFGGVAVSGNATGLDPTDTIGKDYINLTLEQILAQLENSSATKDWYDKGVESVLDGDVSGSIDLPLTVGAGAATLNPDVAADEDLVYYPPFEKELEDVRSGDTAASDVTAGQEQAKTETATADVAENQSVVSSLVSWALDYISPDKGLFSKFPLCVPYDAYLIACSVLGVDAKGISDVTGASPGDLDTAIYSDDGIAVQSDFHPVISIKNDFEVDGKTYPIDIEIDLSPWQPLVSFLRNGVSLLVLAELVGSEYKRIRGH